MPAQFLPDCCVTTADNQPSEMTFAWLSPGVTCVPRFATACLAAVVAKWRSSQLPRFLDASRCHEDPCLRGPWLTRKGCRFDWHTSIRRGYPLQSPSTGRSVSSQTCLLV